MQICLPSQHTNLPLDLVSPIMLIPHVQHLGAVGTS